MRNERIVGKIDLGRAKPRVQRRVRRRHRREHKPRSHDSRVGAPTAIVRLSKDRETKLAGVAASRAQRPTPLNDDDAARPANAFERQQMRRQPTLFPAIDSRFGHGEHVEPCCAALERKVSHRGRVLMPRIHDGAFEPYHRVHCVPVGESDRGHGNAGRGAASNPENVARALVAVLLR
eukprot:Amastigsp_a677121_17.p2 type:complete len:178 gc:universal Amastigsp_a677121_17:637-1170(+)